MSSIANLQYFSQVDQLVEQYRYLQRKPARALESKKSILNIRNAVLADLKTKLKTLQSTVKDLSKTGTESKFNAFTVATTNSSVASATATSSAIIGSHTLKVTQLAKNDTVLSDRITSSSTSIADAEGAGTKTLKVTINGEETEFSVDVTAGESNDSVLTKIVSAINASGANITASAVADSSTTKKLVLVSKNTGAAQAISLSNVSGTLWDQLGLNSSVISGRTAAGTTTAGFTYSSVSSLNSLFTINGIDLERESNSISDVLTGVTFELKGTQSGSDAPVTLTVGVDKAGIKEKVQKFITDFNDVIKYLNTKTKFDPETKTREALSGDAVFSRLKVDLRTISSGVVSSVQAEDPNALSAIGITFASDGTMTLSDSATFDEMLANGSEKVAALFNSSSGVAVKLQSVLDSMLNSSTGQLDAASKTTSSQISNLTDRIKRFDARLEKQVEKYRNDFLKLQAVYYQISAQQQTISSILAAYSY